MNTRIILLALLLATGIHTVALAEATPEATEWLDRLHGLVEDQPFRMDYTVKIDGAHDGESISASVKGNLLQSGVNHMVNDLEMEFVGGPSGEGAMTMKSMQVSDGTTLWAETHLTSLGITQVGKIDLAALAKMKTERSGLEIDQAMMFMDPVSQVESLIKAFDITVDKTKGETVTLLLTPTAETAAMMGDQIADIEKTSGKLVLRKADAVPQSVDIALGNSMTIIVNFSNFEALSAEDIPEGTFSYTPEAGANVMDMTPMITGGSH